MTDVQSKPAPELTETSRPYYEAAGRGELVIQRCSSCGAYVFFPRVACPHCLDLDSLRWVAASGRGEVYSYCVVHRPQHPSFYADVPIVFAAIQLEEGPVMLSEVRGIAPEEVEIGLAVRVEFAEVGRGVSVPVWVPAA